MWMIWHVLVGVRDTVTDENFDSRTKSLMGAPVGIKRRRNAKLDAVDDTRWSDYAGGTHAREPRTDPPRTRAQETPSGNPDPRVILIDSEERSGYEQAKREQAIERSARSWRS
jgi:hypothetical protein